MVLQLADDLYVLALFAEHLPDGMNIGGLTDEGGENHVHALLHAKLQVLDVLLRHGRQVDGSARQIDALLATQHTAVANFTHQVVVA